MPSVRVHRSIARQALAAGDPAGALQYLDLVGAEVEPDRDLLRALALQGLGRPGEALAAVHAYLKARYDHPGDGRHDPQAHAEAMGLLSHLEAVAASGRGDASAAARGAAQAGPAAGPAWPPGGVIHGRWEVRGSAQGGMGVVHFVYDREWQTELAVKTFLPGGGPADAERARHLFRREAMQWLDLGAHPNVVTAHYVLDIDGALRLFMEYIAGQNLALARRGPTPISETLDLGAQIAAGVQHAHAKGLAHRDLKPQNCLLGEDGLRVTDFGLAGPLAQRRDSLTGEGGAGTALYMAPEQWRSLAMAGAPADVYALGLILFGLAAGEHPFDLAPARRRRYLGRVAGPLAGLLAVEALPQASVRDVLREMHAQLTPLDLREVVPGAPAPLAALIARCLQKDPSARPKIEEVRSALLAMYRALSGGKAPRTAVAALPDIEASESNRACSYLVMGDVAGAKRILDAYLTREPDALLSWINRATIAVNAAEAPAAMVDLSFVGKLDGLPEQMTRAPAIEAFERELGRWIVPRDAEIASFSPDGQRLAGARRDGDGWVCWLLDRTSGFTSTWCEIEEPIALLGFDGDGAPFALAVGEERRAWKVRPARGSAAERRELGKAAGVGPGGHCLIEVAPGDLRSVSLYDGRVAAGFRVPPEHEYRRLFALDGEGTRLVWVGEEEGRPRLRLIDARGQELLSLSMRCWPSTIAMPSIHRLVVQYTDGLVRVVDLGRRGVMSQHHAYAGTLVCDPGARWAAFRRGVREPAQKMDGTVEVRERDVSLVLLDLVTGGPAFDVPVPDDSVPCAISPDGGWIAAASARAKRTRLWPDRRLRLAPPVPSLRAHFTLNLAARGRIERRKAHERLLAELERAPGPTTWRALSELRDGTPELQADAEAVVRSARACSRWAVSRGVKRFFRAWSQPTPEVTAVAIAASGEWVASAHADRTLRVWSRTGDPIATIPLPGAPGMLHVAPDDCTLFAAAGEHGERACPVVAVDPATWSIRWTRPVVCWSIACSKGGKRVAAATFDGVLVLDETGTTISREAVDVLAWRPPNAEVLGAPKEHEEVTTARGALVTHDGRALGSAEGGVSRLLWAPDARRLAAGDRMWTFMTGRLEPDVRTPPSLGIDDFWPGLHGLAVSACQFVAGGRLLIVTREVHGSAPAIAWLDVRSGEARALIPATNALPPSACKDGSLMVTAREQSVQVWGIEHAWAFAEDMADEHGPLPEEEENGMLPLPPAAHKLGSLDKPGARVGKLWSPNTPPRDIQEDLWIAKERPGLDPGLEDHLGALSAFQMGRNMNLATLFENDPKKRNHHVRIKPGKGKLR